MKLLADRRRHPMALVALLLVALLLTGGAYALFTQTSSAKADTASASDIEEGKKLFAANCATCHGMNAEGSKAGPGLIGVGAAAVDFQVGTGRMPLQANGPQARVKEPQFDEEQTSQLAAYVASLGPGPAVPDEEYLDASKGDPAAGGGLFRTNCAMCHNVVGSGGALTRGKYAPNLSEVSEKHLYEAMQTGPQNMPIFNDANLTPDDKRDVIAYVKEVSDNPSPGGFKLGSLGPVAEGLFIWFFGLAAVIGMTVWLSSRSK
ncbi:MULTISPECIES: cytochrome c [unclassified Brevibacterium]|uniref:cytochrome bc1 complex diheme cytochrome c subunit n=1 Tax=unclassified Brevibacterium TaxID=2614124 RepID=UPI001BA8F969|nr:MULTISPECIES: cytochrome c [unclassified Brevibacterium]QUL80502.1 c-type cytochrome [Brevibacterium sp. SMBL_HHYL_HB1]HJA60411.1 cytochrome c [Candidatus Brevibacterium intestinavium]